MTQFSTSLELIDHRMENHNIRLVKCRVRHDMNGCITYTHERNSTNGEDFVSVHKKARWD